MPGSNQGDPKSFLFESFKMAKCIRDGGSDALVFAFNFACLLKNATKMPCSKCFIMVIYLSVNELVKFDFCSTCIFKR